MEWLSLTNVQRMISLTQASYASGITVKAIEKDWWVTLTLKALFQSAYSENLVFKGGTSLSKCWKLIERFSEDIDLGLDPQTFGMNYESNATKSYVERLKRRGCEFTSTELKVEIEKQFAALGISKELINVEAEPVPREFPDTDPQVLHMRYKSLYDPITYIADEVKIEVSVRSTKTPFTTRPVNSILFEMLPDIVLKETPFSVFVVEPRKTFLEKIFLLHEEFLKPDQSRIRTERMSRHLYDLGKMAGTEIEQAAFSDELYANLIKHRESYSRLPWVDYKTLQSETISFIPPAELLPIYRKDYQTMEEQMIYGSALEFDKLIENLRGLQERIRSERFDI